MNLLAIYALVVLVVTLGAWAQHDDLPVWGFPFVYLGIFMLLLVGLFLFVVGLLIVVLGTLAGFAPKTGTPSASPPQSDGYGQHFS
jgi:hypothetical protein